MNLSSFLADSSELKKTYMKVQVDGITYKLNYSLLCERIIQQSFLMMILTMGKSE